MSVVIRLSRQGKRHTAFFRIAVADSRKAATGKFLQHIGYYDPNQNPPTVKVDEESALKWLEVGAQPSDTVRSLFQHQGIMDKFSTLRKGKNKKKASEITGKIVPWKARKVPKLHKVKKEALAKEKEAQAKAAEAAAAAPAPAAEAPAA